MFSIQRNQTLFKIMQTQDFTVTLTIDQTPAVIFDTIKNVRGWWSGLYAEEFEGGTEKIGDEFSFRAGGGAHYSKQKLIELVPGKKIVWLVTDSELSFLSNKKEWTGTKLQFDIEAKEGRTQLIFTHLGLVPSIACYDSCSGAWRQYLQERLLQLLNGREKTLQ